MINSTLKIENPPLYHSLCPVYRVCCHPNAHCPLVLKRSANNSVLKLTGLSYFITQMNVSSIEYEYEHEHWSNFGDTTGGPHVRNSSLARITLTIRLNLRLIGYDSTETCSLTYYAELWPMYFFYHVLHSSIFLTPQTILTIY